MTKTAAAWFAMRDAQAEVVRLNDWLCKAHSQDPRFDSMVKAYEAALDRRVKAESWYAHCVTR